MSRVIQSLGVALSDEFDQLERDCRELSTTEAPAKS